jgi:sugar-specific transcriptional regulator TrmB
MSKKMTKAEKVWAYLLKNKLASTAEVAKATGVSYGYTYKLMQRIGTPKEVFEAEAKPERTRVKLLSEASALVDGDREAEHGDFQSNAMTIARYWNAHLGTSDSFIKPHDVPTMLALMKLARSIQKPEGMDNYRDAAGYIALAGELNSKD